MKIQQKFENFDNALERLNEIKTSKNFSDLEKTGLVQRFNFTIELAWKTLETILEFEGNLEQIRGSKDVVRIALKRGLITNGEVWMEMLDKRNQIAHEYNETKSIIIFSRIKKVFVEELNVFKDFVQKTYIK
jgi:nucleotidyltransferase substrate binding protein (TIGR01987 family)